MVTRDEIIAGLTFVPFAFDGISGAATKDTRDQVRSGAVLKLKGGSLYFVGDCNEILGVCDDCREFDYDDIAEIAYLWDEEPEDEPKSWEESLKEELEKRGLDGS